MLVLSVVYLPAMLASKYSNLRKSALSKSSGRKSIKYNI